MQAARPVLGAQVCIDSYDISTLRDAPLSACRGADVVLQRNAEASGDECGGEAFQGIERSRFTICDGARAERGERVCWLERGAIGYRSVSAVVSELYRINFVYLPESHC